MSSSLKEARRAWEDYADELRRYPPNALMLLQIDVEMNPLPRDKGLCFASFALPPGSIDKDKRKTLMSLLRFGVPYLYWLHRFPAGADGTAIKGKLADMLAGARTLAEIPSCLRQERSRRNEYAYEATFLWDDPLFHPFLSTRGVK